jgi:hypothetical protein
MLSLQKTELNCVVYTPPCLFTHTNRCASGKGQHRTQNKSFSYHIVELGTFVRIHSDRKFVNYIYRFNIQYSTYCWSFSIMCDRCEYRSLFYRAKYFPSRRNKELTSNRILDRDCSFSTYVFLPR